MQLNYSHVGIQELERLLSFTRQGWYWHRQYLEVNGEGQIIELVKQVRQEHSRIGAEHFTSCSSLSWTEGE